MALVDYIVDALVSLGGEASLAEIEKQVRRTLPVPHPRSLGANIRARIEERCAESQVFQGKANLFESAFGIAARRGIWRLRRDRISTVNDQILDGADAFIEAEEGRAVLRIHLRRERSRKLIHEFKAKLPALTCCACGFDFEKTYGPLGRGYIEAHHTVPVSKLREGATTRLQDLVAVCSNCHRMLHRSGLLDWISLRRLLLKSDPK